jgi:myosin heavy subunit
MEVEYSGMNSLEVAQTVKSAQLELAYERALRQAERIYEEERARVLRVQLLLLEHENDELQEQAARDEDEQHHLQETNEEIRAQLSEVEIDLRETQVDLKARLRDVDHLRAEVDALNAAAADASKLLSEKLSLTRELNTLRPELEHLKSQASAQRELIAEKLALQRELSAVQVELEQEKRAVQRLKAQQENVSAQEVQDAANLSAEVEELRKELNKSHRNAQKVERDTRKKTMEWEGEKEVLEGKLEAFRDKLRSTKDQLKEAQEEIERLETEKMAQSAAMTKARMAGNAATTTITNPRKRNVARFDPDMTIGTPGQRGPAAKKQRVSFNVGDKSNFSITPFLNRTLSILPETPAVEDDGEEQDGDANRHEKASEETNAAAPKSKATKSKPEKSAAAKKLASAGASRTKTSRALKESTNSKANTTMKKPQLAKLLEEPSDIESDREEPETSATTGNADKENSNSEHTDHGNSTSQDNTTDPAKKSKAAAPTRTSIFDEDDEDNERTAAPKVRGLSRGGLVNGGSGSALLGRINLKAKPVGKAKTLADFSPLKRDRRATSVLE